MNVFVDTHIFVDYYLDRSDNIRPLGEFTFNFLKRAVACEFYIFVSEGVLKELEETLRKTRNEIIDVIFSNLTKAKKVEFVTPSEHQITEARMLAEERKIPKSDALFTILARDNNATLISRDWHHKEVEDIVEVKKPEEL